jgi:trk system potassium uptake protein TrkA
MTTYLVIGAGRFGLRLVQELQKTGAAVDVIDKEPTVGCFLKGKYRLFCANVWNLPNIPGLDVRAYDACYLCMQTETWAMTHIVGQLRAAGARRIVVRTDGSRQGGAALRAGADEAVCVEALASRALAQAAARCEAADSPADEPV